MTWLLRDLVADVDDRLLVEVRSLVGPPELDQVVGAQLAGLLLDHDVLRRDVLDRPRLVGEHHVTRIDRRAELDAGAHQRRLGAEQRDGLALHVGAHQGAVGVVVLEERDQRGGHRDQLLRRHVHVVDLVGRDLVDLAALAAHQHLRVLEGAVGGEASVRLRDDVAVLLVGRQVVDLRRDLALLDAPVGGLDEPELVDPAEAGQRPHQADVRTLRGLDRAHPAVVGRVHVSHLEARRARARDRPGRAPTADACG